MKSIYIIIAFSTIIFFACNKEEDHFKVVPETDLVALEGMDEAYASALLYNDSLLVCSFDPINCDSSTMFHYDELFHQFDEMFDFHHENYSHNNVSDDHHHEGGNNVHHGSMHHDDDHDDHDHCDQEEHGQEHEHQHNIEHFELMMELREMHKDIHPG